MNITSVFIFLIIFQKAESEASKQLLEERVLVASVLGSIGNLPALPAAADSKVVHFTFYVPLLRRNEGLCVRRSRLPILYLSD